MMIIFNKKEKELNELYGNIPRAYLTYSNGVTLTLLAILAGMAFFIEFPVAIISTATLTTAPAPEVVTSIDQNEIETILIVDGDKVSVGDPLLVMASDADYNDVNKLQRLLDQSDLNKSNSPELQHLTVINERLKGFRLGAISEPAFDFKFTISLYIQHLQSLDFNASSVSLGNTKNQIETRLQLRKSQFSKIEEELRTLRKNETSYRSLLKKGILSKNEFDKEMKEILKVEEKLNVSLLNISNETERVAKNNFDQSIINIEQKRKAQELQMLLRNKFELLQLALESWERQYLIKSNTDGKVLFTRNLIEKSIIELGTELMLIEPGTTQRNITAEVLVNSSDFGKLEERQMARIVLDGYPENEFGFLGGTVNKIYQIPNENGLYLVELALDRELQTTRGFSIPFRPNLKGNVEIITKKETLGSRFLSRFQH